MTDTPHELTGDHIIGNAIAILRHAPNGEVAEIMYVNAGTAPGDYEALRDVWRELDLVDGMIYSTQRITLSHASLVAAPVKHHATVVPMIALEPDDPNTHTAICTCGWNSAPTTEAEAQVVADLHGSLGLAPPAERTP